MIIKKIKNFGLPQGILRETKEGLDYILPIFKKFLEYLKIPYFDPCCNEVKEAGLPVGFKDGKLQYYNNITNQYTQIVITPSTADPIEFRVSTTSYIANGVNSKIVTSFIGKNIDFIRNGQPQSILTDEPSYYTWNKLTGELFISPNPVEGEIFKIQNG